MVAAAVELILLVRMPLVSIPMRISPGVSAGLREMPVAIVCIRVCFDVSGAHHCVGTAVSTGHIETALILELTSIAGATVHIERRMSLTLVSILIGARMLDWYVLHFPGFRRILVDTRVDLDAHVVEAADHLQRSVAFGVHLAAGLDDFVHGVVVPPNGALEDGAVVFTTNPGDGIGRRREAVITRGICKRTYGSLSYGLGGQIRRQAGRDVMYMRYLGWYVVLRLLCCLRDGSCSVVTHASPIVTS